MTALTLFIGNKNYSSWSLRPWLALKVAGIAFEEVLIPLREPTTKQDILRHTPSGKLPGLKIGDTAIWDSLAICEWVAEQAPDAGLWPTDPLTRAVARSLAAEMHSGFVALRQNMPMDVRERYAGQGLTTEVQADINRITAAWRDARGRFGEAGPFLFGKFTIADAMFAPVAFRFQTYQPDLPDDAQAYVAAMVEHPAMKEWADAAKREPWFFENK
ncbi:glutathione S-transferase family protein [Lacibacterium aquatile]|uniref:Glutathione S-transferase family protein n=1 Tax=Lacibacterium aquatile TaxID=1168082 RepID=A0ABW5DS20_9PROT